MLCYTFFVNYIFVVKIRLLVSMIAYSRSPMETRDATELLNV